MLGALGPRLQRLSMQGLNQDFVSDYWCHRALVPTILTHCTMLVHLQVENVLLRTAVDKVFVNPPMFWHMQPTFATTCLTCTAFTWRLQRWRRCRFERSNGSCVRSRFRCGWGLRRCHAAASCTCAVGQGTRCAGGHRASAAHQCAHAATCNTYVPALVYTHHIAHMSDDSSMCDL